MLSGHWLLPNLNLTLVGAGIKLSDVHNVQSFATVANLQSGIVQDVHLAREDHTLGSHIVPCDNVFAYDCVQIL